LRAQSACASASGRTDSGLAAGRSSAVPRKTACLQVDSGSSEPKSFCGPAEGQVFGLLRPLPRLLAATARSCGQRPPARYQRSRSLGASPVSVRKPRGQPSPRSATRRATAPRAVSFLRRTASEAAAWCPSPWACGAAGTRVIAEGVAFHRRAGVCARTWAGLLIVVPCERPKSGGRHARVQRKPVADGRSARCPGCGGTRARGVRGRAPLSRAPGRGMALALAADSGVACRHGDLSRLWCRAAGAVAVVGRGWRQASGGTSLPSCSASSSGRATEASASTPSPCAGWCSACLSGQVARGWGAL
jgi:hypothetical protein